MKLSSFSFILSLLLYISIEPIIQVNAAKCWDHNNPLEPWKKTESSVCGTQKKSDGPNLTVGLGNTDKASSFLAPPDVFQFVFTCGEKDPNLCNKAKGAFESAGLIIAKVINFNKPLVVNATFTSFCKSLGECGGKILGAASAARTIPLLDDDNNIRQYPQALAKQFPLSPEPEWGPFDIQAFFNSEFDLFFPNDTNIQPNQVDFQYIILHELIHGLGFASSWNSYFTGDGNEAIALTSEPSFLDDLVSPNQQVTFTGFVETAFDKYMVNAKIKGKSPERMSDNTALLNSFAKIGTTFQNVQSLLNAFEDSNSFKVSNSLIADSQTSKTFAFQPHDAKNTDDLVFLETNIKFQQGSSISHVDILSFNNSADFLEVFNAKRGQSLDQLLSSVGGSYPIGPKLLSVLETLGYATANNPNPYSPRLPDSPKLAANVPPPLPVAGDNISKMSQTPASSATSLTSSFNILYVFIIVAVILLF